MKARIYFTSGFTADMEVGTFVVREMHAPVIDPDGDVDYKDIDGRTIINARNVCFVRELGEAEDKHNEDE